MCLITCMWLLTQSKAFVQLQVGSEESSQTAEQFATRLPSVQLVAAVDQTVRRGAVVSFVQNAHQQLPVTNHHLGNKHTGEGEGLSTPKNIRLSI